MEQTVTQKPNATTLPYAVAHHLVRGRAAANVLLVIGASVFIALAAQIAVPLPFTPVPMTLQPLAVLLVGAALGSNRGAATAMLYLVEGFSGLPVFAQGHFGPMWAVGPTAGFLWSYPLAAWLAGRFSERGWGATMPRAIAGMLVALAVVYAGGWSWLTVVSSPAKAFFFGVAPFVLGDIVKVVIGAAFLPYAQRLVKSLSQ
jgi:biotin transport system substrate-specific component